MNENSQRTTLIAGLFVLAGLILLGALIFQFGTLKHRLRQPYRLNAVFLDAQNLIRGAPVKRAGATIGQVVSSPKLVDGLKGVQVTLEIYPEFQIPVGSPLKIASVGLMGDSVIDVGIPPADQLTGEFYAPGMTLTGTGSPDLTATANRITDEILVVMGDLRTGMADLSKTVNRLNSGVLSDENMENFSGGLRDLRHAIQKFDSGVLGESNLQAVEAAIADFQSAMARANGAAGKAGEVLNKADQAMAKVDKAMDQLGPAIGGVGDAAGSLKRAAAASEGLLRDARSGQGLLSALLNDPNLKQNFSALITNLRQRGILFYKDKEKAGESPAPATGNRRSPAPPSRSRTPSKPWGAR